MSSWIQFLFDQIVVSFTFNFRLEFHVLDSPTMSAKASALMHNNSVYIICLTGKARQLHDASRVCDQPSSEHQLS